MSEEQSDYSKHFYSMCGTIFDKKKMFTLKRVKVTCLKCGRRFWSEGNHNHFCGKHSQGSYRGPYEEGLKLDRKEKHSEDVAKAALQKRRKSKCL